MLRHLGIRFVAQSLYRAGTQSSTRIEYRQFGKTDIWEDKLFSSNRKHYFRRDKRLGGRDRIQAG